MFTLSKRNRRFITGIITAVAIGLAFCLISQFNLLHKTNIQSGDFLYKAADSNPGIDPGNPIVIVTIDDNSLEQLGRFSSWPRAYHTRLINTLAADGARVIVFDILFSEPAPGDDELIASMQQAGNVILPFAGTIEPLKPLEASALAMGNASMIPDEDGIVRRLLLAAPHGTNSETALSLAAVAKYLRRPQIIESPVKDNNLYLAGRSIPLDNAGNMLINYTGNSFSSVSFKTVSYADVLGNNFNQDAFRDKIVIIGATAVGLGDTFWTPMGRMMSGVELHANAMHTILTGSFLKPASSGVTILSILLLSLLCGMAVLRFRTLRATLATCLLGSLYLLAAFYYFDHGIMLDILYPPLTVAGVFVGVNLHNVTSERLEKREITRTFGRYVSPSVATEILDAVNKGSLKLGGDEYIATILFADVRNFTRFSEKRDPQELVGILNRYFSVIIESSLRYGGMVNKFAGDNIMVIWNVPISCPEHALMAARAAIRAQQSIRELQERMIHLPRLEFGIGVNTGNVVAGNMGSADRLEYSVMGDTVNTAARLASVTLGGRVWVGIGTFELIKDYVKAIPLEPLMLKGKLEPIQAYEITEIQYQRYEGLESALVPSVNRKV